MQGIDDNTRQYTYLDKSERISIEKGIKSRTSLRKIVDSLGRSASIIRVRSHDNGRAGTEMGAQVQIAPTRPNCTYTPKFKQRQIQAKLWA